MTDERAPGVADALLSPAWRDPDRNSGRIFDGGDERLRRRLYEERLGIDADDPLNRQRRVSEKPAGVTLAASGIRLRADDPQGRARRRRQPRAELERGPVVVSAAERNEDAAPLSHLASCEDGDVGK